jgi:subtilisin family serine protease
MPIKILKPHATGILPIFFSILFICALASPAFAGKMPEGKRPTVAYQNPKAEFLAGQVIVKFKDGYNADSIRKPSAYGLREWHGISFGFTRFFIDGDVLKACEELMKDPAIEIAEPNYVRHLLATPNDPLFYRQDNLKLSHAELGWNIETGDANVIVAVIDTGVDKQHPDLVYNLIPGANFRESGDDEMDDSGHGTAVSGVVGAVGNNNVGLTGAAWNVSILPLRACGGQGLTCNVIDETEAVEEAIIQGADIINLSLGGFGRSTLEETAINNAWDAGLVVFAAAGNQGLLGKIGDPETESNINYPAGYDNVCGVGSVDYPPTGNLSLIVRSDFSNSGDAVSVTAVGSSVITTAPSVPVEFLIFNEQADYGKIDGTSFSTPLVSGLAALIKSHFPNLTNAELRTKIETCVWDIGPAGWDNDFGYGLVDFQKVMVGSTHASNTAFNFGITTSPIFNDDIIIVVKVKQPINGDPQLTYSYLDGGNLRSGSIQMMKLPNQNNVWATRYHTLFSGTITFKVNGIAQGGGNLPELSMDYSKGKSN